MLTDKEIRPIAQAIVNEAKATARVDQGTLKRSISYTVDQGVYIFRQMYYGDFNDNSQLERIIRHKFPRGVPYRVSLLDLNGRVKEQTRIKTGSASQKSLLPTLTKIGTSAVTSLINRIRNRGKA